jgi:hypothetical protein
MQYTKARVQKHFDRLLALANRKKNKGVLPSYKWLNGNGFFTSYDIVRHAGLLGEFKRASLRKLPK